LRRNDEVVCESLQEDFYRLLQGSDGVRTPEEIFAGGIDRREAEEILEFATSEGILVANRPTEAPARNVQMTGSR